MYAKLENNRYIEVQGNGVSKEILDKLGFIPLVKFSGTLEANQHIIIEKNGDVCREIVITKEFYVKFGTQDPVLIGAQTRSFLDGHFKDALIVDEQGRTRKNRWKIGNPELKRMRKLVWERWDKELGEFIEQKITSDEENAQDGISLHDLILYAFFDSWPLQGKNGKRALKAVEITRIKNEVKAQLIAKRDAVELACIPADNTGPVLLAALDATARWVLTGEV